MLLTPNRFAPAWASYGPGLKGPSTGFQVEFNVKIEGELVSWAITGSRFFRSFFEHINLWDFWPDP